MQEFHLGSMLLQSILHVGLVKAMYLSSTRRKSILVLRTLIAQYHKGLCSKAGEGFWTRVYQSMDDTSLFWLKFSPATSKVIIEVRLLNRCPRQCPVSKYQGKEDYSLHSHLVRVLHRNGDILEHLSSFVQRQPNAMIYFIKNPGGQPHAESNSSHSSSSSSNS